MACLYYADINYELHHLISHTEVYSQSMSTNFQFLKNEFATFYDRAHNAEQSVITDPRASLFYARMALEVAVNWMFVNDEELELPYDKSLHSLLIDQTFKAQFNHKIYNELHLIKKTGNLAAHNKPVSDVDSHTIIEHLYYFARWFAKSYAQTDPGNLGVFEFSFIPQKGSGALSRKQIIELQSQFDKELDSYQELIKTKEEERQKLAEENQLFKRQIEALQPFLLDN